MKQCQLTGHSHREGLSSWMRQSGSNDWVSLSRKSMSSCVRSSCVVTIPIEVEPTCLECEICLRGKLCLGLFEFNAPALGIAPRLPSPCC
jgi:hypothetical protein